MRMLRFLLLVALITAGCGHARRGEPIAGPFVPATERIALGQRAFMTACHQCHPGGMAGLGPALNDKPLPGFLIKMQIRQGFGAMPSFDSQKISDERADAIIAYLKAMRNHGET